MLRSRPADFQLTCCLLDLLKGFAVLLDLLCCLCAAGPVLGNRPGALQQKEPHEIMNRGKKGHLSTVAGAAVDKLIR